MKNNKLIDMQLNIKGILIKVKIYGRYLSEFLLPDQVDILAKSLKKTSRKGIKYIRY